MKHKSNKGEQFTSLPCEVYYGMMSPTPDRLGEGDITYVPSHVSGHVDVSRVRTNEGN